MDFRSLQLPESTPENGGRPEMKEVPDSEQEWDADLVLLALGFVGPEPDNVIARLGLDLRPVDGVVRAPSSFVMTLGSLPSMTATTEFVVPRSMPMILPILASPVGLSS